MTHPIDWEAFDRQGFVRLGRVLDADDLAALRNRIDDIMMGRAEVDYGRMLMQLDSTSGNYQDAGEQSRGWKGATLNYRKVQELEFDPMFLAYMQRPIFRDICDHVYGPQTPIAAYRAMFMNKPAHQGTMLPWHQDRWADLSQDPLLTTWTALDAATVANGCVQVVPGSHRLGLINPAHGSGFLTTEQAAAQATPDKIVHLELEPGEAVLLHNWLLHSSDVNRTETPRRAFSVCYMDASTTAANGEQFSLIFEPEPSLD